MTNLQQFHIHEKTRITAETLGTNTVVGSAVQHTVLALKLHITQDFRTQAQIVKRFLRQTISGSQLHIFIIPVWHGFKEQCEKKACPRPKCQTGHDKSKHCWRPGCVEVDILSVNATLGCILSRTNTDCPLTCAARLPVFAGSGNTYFMALCSTPHGHVWLHERQRDEEAALFD